MFAVVAALGVTAPMVWALDEFATPRPTPKSQAPIKTQAPLGNRVTEVSVLRTPDVVGQPVATAHVTLEKNRLRVGRETTQPTSGRAAGTVLGQDPKAGTPVQPGAAVNLVIAAPARVVAAPAPWKRLPIERVPSGNRVPSDDAGGSTPPPQRVVLVPNLIGRQATIASEILAKPGLRLGERRDQDSDAPAGTVIAQFPAPETPVRPGTSVNVTIAVDDRVTVPDLTRDTLPQAARVLREYHLGLGQHHERESSAPTGTVIGQAPAPGTRVAPGTPVNVQIAKAPAPVLPPAPTPPPGVVPPPVVIAPPAIPPIVIQPPAPPAPPVVAAPPTPPAPQLPPVPPAPPVTTAPPPPPPAPPVAAPSPTPAPASKPTPKPRQPTPAVRPAPRAPAASQSPTVAQSPAPKPAPPIVAQAPAPEPDQPKRGWPSPIALGLGSAALLAAAGAVYYRMRTVNGTTLPSITYAAHWDLGTQQIEAVAPLSLGVGLRLHSGVEVATTTLETNTLVATGHQMGGTG